MSNGQVAIQTKCCSMCRTMKGRDEFSPNKRVKDGLNYYCRDCRNEKYRKGEWNNGVAAHRHESTVVQLARRFEAAQRQVVTTKAAYEHAISERATARAELDAALAAVDTEQTV